MKEYLRRVAACRNSGLSVLAWCKENGVCSQTYYKWQKRLFAMSEAQQETQFAEVTPVSAMQTNSQIAVTVRVAGIAADIHNGANPATVESVLRILKLC
ncbi:MAG: IS66 family insertion sequence element accessory protein TnpB [Oscillospiraceae bacterium]|nr:IS66 family insertion sequence element accessory protein TnpB [Oscillospiraceae bacterium]